MYSIHILDNWTWREGCTYSWRVTRVHLCAYTRIYIYWSREFPWESLLPAAQYQSTGIQEGQQPFQRPVERERPPLSKGTFNVCWDIHANHQRVKERPLGKGIYLDFPFIVNRTMLKRLLYLNNLYHTIFMDFKVSSFHQNIHRISITTIT